MQLAWSLLPDRPPTRSPPTPGCSFSVKHGLCRAASPPAYWLCNVNAGPSGACSARLPIHIKTARAASSRWFLLGGTRVLVFQLMAGRSKTETEGTDSRVCVILLRFSFRTRASWLPGGDVCTRFWHHRKRYLVQHLTYDHHHHPTQPHTNILVTLFNCYSHLALSSSVNVVFGWEIAKFSFVLFLPVSSRLQMKKRQSKNWVSAMWVVYCIQSPIWRTYRSTIFYFASRTFCDKSWKISGRWLKAFLQSPSKYWFFPPEDFPISLSRTFHRSLAWMHVRDQPPTRMREWSSAFLVSMRTSAGHLQATLDTVFTSMSILR